MRGTLRPRVDEVCHDAAEVLTLSISRFIAAASMTGDAACWDAAHACAEEVLGATDSPRIVAAMAGIMRALKVERLEPWAFLPAPCCRVTDEEADLISALQLARTGRRDALYEAALHLTGGNCAPRLADALVSAAELLAELAPKLAMPVREARSVRMH